MTEKESGGGVAGVDGGGVKRGLGRIFRSRTKSLEMEIDQYLGYLDQAALLLGDALKKYFEGKYGDFEQKSKEIDGAERRADELRRTITHRIYAEMLIPDSRGDVLGLVETIDNIADLAKQVAGQFSIEKPRIYPFLRDDFEELTELSLKAAAEISLAVRAYFCEVYRVNEHLDKVHFWEHQADLVEERIKRRAFESDEVGGLSERMHVRDFAESISRLADESEAVAERLSISVIKRTI